MINPKIKIYNTSNEINNYLSDAIIESLSKKSDLFMTIATGNTTKDLLPVLTEKLKKNKLSLAKTRFFGVDEYWPLPKNSPVSVSYRIFSQFFEHTDANKNNLFFPDCTAKDINKETSRLQDLFDKNGPLDIAVLGIGPGHTCHLGLNEPGSDADTKIRYVPLTEESRRAMKKKFPNSPESEIPKGGITLGMSEILGAKKIYLAAFGEGKAWGIHRTLKGNPDSEAPASLLQNHPGLEVVIDKAAASKL